MDRSHKKMMLMGTLAFAIAGAAEASQNSICRLRTNGSLGANDRGRQ
jgi:hypothetical protein